MKKKNLLQGIAVNRNELKNIKGGAQKTHLGKPAAPMSVGSFKSEDGSCYRCCWNDQPDNCSASVSVPVNSTCVGGAFLQTWPCSTQS